MPKIPRVLIILLVIGFLFAVIWPKVRIYIFIPMSIGQALLIFGVAAIALFLVIDHLLNRSRT